MHPSLHLFEQDVQLISTLPAQPPGPGELLEAPPVDLAEERRREPVDARRGGVATGLPEGGEVRQPFAAMSVHEKEFPAPDGPVLSIPHTVQGEA